MKETFRRSMHWLHTWAGVVLGSLLFVIFLMGTLSVFNQEIDRWMIPDTRIEAPDSFSFDAFAETASELGPDAQMWGLILPRERIPFARFFYRDSTGAFSESKKLDLVSGEVLPKAESFAGTGFIFPFHYSLHLKWKNVGYWLVGLAGMFMLVLLITGVVVHVRMIFKDAFTFRPQGRLLRSTLDLHNLTGVLVLPFHFLIALSGVIIFMNIYFPQAAELAYGEEDEPRTEFFGEAYDRYEREAAGVPATSQASIDAMIEHATAAWDGIPPYFIRVFHPGDANGYVSVRRGYQDHVLFDRNVYFYDAGTGEVLHHFDVAPVMKAQHFLVGFHIIQFDHWALRWVYFLAGLAGCILIGTGFIYWLEKRRSKHEKLGLKGVRIVEMLTMGSVTGIMVATVAFFAVNRVLPLGIEWAGQERATLEVLAFFLIWIGTFAHAWFRPRQAWKEQLWAIVALSVIAVALNALTTGDHMIRSFSEQQWAVFGMDATLLVTAVLSAWIALRLGRKAESTDEPAKAAAARARSVRRVAERPPAVPADVSGGDGSPAEHAPTPKERSNE
ncbi:MAG: PepSY-associated TM helix domain-containing protein [Bacteroidota bacterium]